MSIWWVNMGSGFDAQMNASALWAPSHGRTETGELYNPRWHWQILEEVMPGEFVVLCEDQHIMGIAMVTETARPDSPPPAGLELYRTWHDRGWLVPVKLALLAKSLKRNTLAEGLFLTKSDRSPVRRNSEGKLQGNQLYSTRIPEIDADQFFERVIHALQDQKPGSFEALVNNGIEATTANAGPGDAATTKEALVLARVGQGRFRAQLLTRWKSQCCATGLAHPRLLRASHILAWSQSNNLQRLDEFNGLLLSAAFDAAFDAHLITLGEDGSWEWDPTLSDEDLRMAGLQDIRNQSVQGLTPEHGPYLALHRAKAREMWVVPPS